MAIAPGHERAGALYRVSVLPCAILLSANCRISSAASTGQPRRLRSFSVSAWSVSFLPTQHFARVVFAVLYGECEQPVFGQFTL